MADPDSTGSPPAAFPDAIALGFSDFGILRCHELETLSRCAMGLDSIVALLAGDRLAGEANEHGEDCPRLSVLQRSGLLSAAAVLVDTLHRVTDAHMGSTPAERDARHAYSLALATGTLERTHGGADGTDNA